MKCRKHEPQASVFYICFRLLHLLYNIEVMWRKTINYAFSMFCMGLRPIRVRAESHLYYNKHIKGNLDIIILMLIPIARSTFLLCIL